MENQPTPYSEDSKQYVEVQKIVFDYIKHITALDTGAIILLTVLLEKFFKVPRWSVLIYSTFMGFGFSIIALTLAGFGVVRSVHTPDKIESGLAEFTTWTFILGLIGFLVGIMSIALLVVKNWR
jgi:hypothetical protein